MRLDRLLIEKIENRILVGILSFVGIMVITGWIAINEPARMQAFEQQFTGRSIERGAYLFNQNCSTCHGIDGKGLQGRAPGLNNPHLFGYDFMEAERRELETLGREIQIGQLVIDEYDELTASIAAGELSGDELATAEARVAELEPQLPEASARITDAEAQIAEIEAVMADIEAQMAAAIERGYPVNTPERLDQVSWEGSLENYVLTTLVHGRPGSTILWPASGGGMAAWGQTAGGPLREDQLQDLTNYIMNWNKDWTIDDLNEVNQFAKEPLDPASVSLASADDSSGPIGTDVDAILVELENYTGDPINGQTIYNGAYACSGCHGNEIVAPLTELTWLKANSGEDGRPYSDEPQRYIVESIVNPGAFVVPPYPSGAMPGNFSELISHQELADIIAYVSSYDS